MNVHLAGEQLTQFDIRNFSSHEIQVARAGVVSETIVASSPPIGHDILGDMSGSFAITEHNRVFYYSVDQMPSFGYPIAGDLITALSDQSTWRVVRGLDEAAWSWFGQNQSMVKVLVKRDGPIIAPPVGIGEAVIGSTFIVGPIF